ncbi:mediator of RNA polymerase II transcription subunit 12 [Anopheles gambiae]|uniref:mediator of RNA polymerase II transcription subunit 12 n=1 Tax=Anopheles gambiae TaxID=7165 RepID=UPI002AC93E53|nr:mediator of RNA polymerase II transcription subunit 12 [Anopheles gambiae]XP_061496906.1 mediator of RNA polymerase II transcription subunit 12 [Anopheles gambiae]XP_061496907.1 mediator of RNA polymerase II transcription subunit 12 [Anopheles gambiae]XP_061496908.1 mediator of RNA polymerase II transcription subunit 12 [Anopheles gambiae]XP_061496909.1 mediator of RNA polymerase II transcription subunit 12 [Anopheles gambiae]XP_061496910.1 mediator of RNA polymerase II transcription subuni
MSHGGATRYSQYASNGAGPQQSNGTGSGKASSNNAAQQQQQQQQPQVPSLPFMRPPMLVTSSGASMLPPPPCPQTPPTGGGSGGGGGGGGLPKYPGSPNGSLSGSDTDVSTSNENLSREERYVLSHARVEPQGEENLQGNVTPVNEIQGRFIGDKFSSNTSSDSTRYATPTGGSSSRSMSETRGGGGGMYANIGSAPDGPSNRSSMAGSNRNSLKEPNSNRSSMDVSQSSYNTLIIHDDIYSSVASSGREYAGSPPPYMKKERPRSYGEAAPAAPPMQDISEINEEYINKSHVLKHLAKEVKLSRATTARNSRQQSSSGGSAVSNGGGSDVGEQKMSSHGTGGSKAARRGSEAATGGGSGNSAAKLKSKSQPDLTRMYDIDPEEVEALVKENQVLKQQLNNCYLKVAKSQKLEQEIANIYRVHEELVQSCDRRERLERAARTRLQQDCRRLQELNRAFRDQVEVYQSQLHASSDHQLGRTQQDVLISQLVNQNKSLIDANRRQCIELQAQNATLEEQRIHINVLDTALKRLEEECRQKQVYVERCAQLQHALQSLQNASERREQAERKLRIDYDNDMANRSGSSTNSETDNLKWQLREKDAQILRLEAECAQLEQRNLEESNVRNVAKLAMERNSQETERILAEAKQEKIRYLDEAHAANRKVTELQTRLKLVENRLAEKDAMIRAYQGQKIYGGSTNSYGSYNLSSDSFALNPLGAYNSQASYVDVSSGAYDVATGAGASLLDPSSVVVGPYGPAATAAVVSSYASTYGPTTVSNASSFAQSSLNLPTGAGVGGGSGAGGGPGGPVGAYSSPGSSSTTSNYSSTANFGAGSEHTIYDSKSYDAQRKSIDDQLKQLDEQLLSKRGLCCFPSLTTKKPIQSLLADEVSVLSTNNSETFLQNLAHIGSDRRSEQPPDRDQLSNGGAGGQKADDMVLLEKQGRCSQKLRGGSSSSSGTLGNLAHVSQTVGQNMTDISNIGGTGGNGDASSGGSGVSSTGNKVSKMLSGVSQQRGSSLPPSALPRPPRSLKPPRKIEYGRLSDGGSDSGKKTRAATPPSPVSSSGASQSGGSLKRSGREFSPAKGGGYVEMKDTLQLTKDYQGGTLKHKTYGSMTTVGGGGMQAGGVAPSKFGFGSSKSGTGTSGPAGSDYPSTKNYQRLEDPSAGTSVGHHHNNSSSQSSSQSRKSSGDSSGTLKRSLLPNTGRKPNVGGSHGMPKGGGSRDSLNSASSGSNHSNLGQTRSSPQPQPHPAGSGYNQQSHQMTSRTPPRFLQQQQHHHHQPSTSVESNKSSYHSIPAQSSAQHFHQGFFAKFPGSVHAGSPVRTLQQHPKTSSSLPSSSILHAAANSSATSAIGQSSTASLPPKPSMLDKMVAAGSSAGSQQQQQQRRGSSLARTENKYRIQF